MCKRPIAKPIVHKAAVSTMMVLLLCTCCRSASAAEPEVLQRIVLHEDWRLRSLSPHESLDNALLAEAAQKGGDWLEAGIMPRRL